MATAWYAHRLPQVEVYLLTNDADNRRKALEQGLKAMSVQVCLSCPLMFSVMLPTHAAQGSTIGRRFCFSIAKSSYAFEQGLNAITESGMHSGKA